MFANLVRLALAAELSAWAIVVAWAAGRFAWGASSAVAGVMAGLLGVRLLIVCSTFAASWLSRSPREPAQRLGPAGTAWLLLVEWKAMVANNFLWLPLERLVLRADPPLAPNKRVPVVLVHGYFSNRGTLSGLARALDAAGVETVFAPSLPAVIAPIEEFAGHLARVIEEIAEATGQPRVILVCHSMGGLAARSYLATHGPGRVAGLVTLASPHHGTLLAAVATGANGRQMRVGSDFLAGLQRAEGDAGPGCTALSVYSVHDNLVAPQDSSRLAWARNVSIHGVGHLALLLDPRLHRAVTDEVAAVRARQAG